LYRIRLRAEQDHQIGGSKHYKQKQRHDASGEGDFHQQELSREWEYKIDYGVFLIVLFIFNISLIGQNLDKQILTHTVSNLGFCTLRLARLEQLYRE